MSREIMMLDRKNLIGTPTGPDNVFARIGTFCPTMRIKIF